MHPKFADAVEALHEKFETLLREPPLLNRRLSPKQGVYLFSESGEALYVGRSNNIPERYNAHCSVSSLENRAAFAMLLAREETGMRASYRQGQGRKLLMGHEVFRPAFDRAKARIANMEFRAVEEVNQTRQALLEIYVAVAASARYNDFATH